ncbi:MAG: hypothetical protein IPP44_30620 [Ideonella sp.]|nr:hypothetical protein [Ideonella sp.]
MAAIEQDDALEALLQVFPAMAQVYENMRCCSPGLCRSSLDDSLSTELAAKRRLLGHREAWHDSAHLTRPNLGVHRLPFDSRVLPW